MFRDPSFKNASEIVAEEPIQLISSPPSNEPTIDTIAPRQNNMLLQMRFCRKYKYNFLFLRIYYTL